MKSEIKKYNLRILYPSSNKYKTDQFRLVDIYANDTIYDGNSILFVNYPTNVGYTLIASYPQNYTIIENITVTEE